MGDLRDEVEACESVSAAEFLRMEDVVEDALSLREKSPMIAEGVTVEMKWQTGM